MPRTGSPYDYRYQRERAGVLARGARCQCGAPATEADHDPPLSLHRHIGGSGCCMLVPSCAKCARLQGGQLRHEAPRLSAPALKLLPEFVGAAADDDVWDVDWLAPLLDVPDDAVWPRLMTCPHPDAVGSFGAEFVGWAQDRSGPLRWWQRLVAVRLLEHDRAGHLVWEQLLLTLARQLGKSWLLRELFMWRIGQGARFGEPQLVLHTGKDLAICKEVQRPVRVTAKADPATWKVREINGQEEIEHLADGSRWMIRSKFAVYGYSASLAGVDEAWSVSANAVEEGIEPTMIERRDPQLLLVSTAHRLATPLFLTRRLAAAATLFMPEATLLIEWSPPRDAPIDDEATWRMASPSWSPRRRSMCARRLAAALAGESDDPDEPDPVEAFKAQWLNMWPARTTGHTTETLLSDGVWHAAQSVPAPTVGPLRIAVEDNFGSGAAVAAVGRDETGVFEVDGWLCPSVDTAIAEATALAATRPGSKLTVGASLSSRCQELHPFPTLAGAAQTRAGLALLRDLTAAAAVVHDSTPELDQQFAAMRVRQGSAGLVWLPGTRCDLAKAAVWALLAAQTRPTAPAVH